MPHLGTPFAGNTQSDRHLVQDLDNDRVSSVGKALGLLSAFRGSSPPIGLSELARRAGLPKSTAFRLLGDLEKANFVERDGQNYRLGMALFELGNRVRFVRPNELRDVSMHHMSRLHVQTGLNVHLALLRGTNVVYIAKINHSRTTLRGHFQPGASVAASCSALGKAILAYSPREVIKNVIDQGLPVRTKWSIREPARLLRELSKVHEEGVAFEREEATLGVGAIAAPIKLGPQAIAAIAVSLTPPLLHTERIASDVRETAKQISVEYATLSGQSW